MNNSTRFFFSLLLMLGLSLQGMAQMPTAKVFKRDADTDYYGKLFVPQGGKYKLKRTPQEGTTISLYYGHVDRTRIYMIPMVVTEDYYYIDATECTHAFVVRSTNPDDVVMVASPAEDQAILDANSSYYWGKALGTQNKLRFAVTSVSNADLRNLSTYKTKAIYCMANPARRGFAFAHLDQFNTTRNMPANSLYVLTQKSSSAPTLEVVWGDEEHADETTAITELPSDNATVAEKAIYTLQGVRVSETVKGNIYICNGKKFIAQ